MFSCKRNIEIEKILKKGEYIMMIEPVWID